MKMVNDCFLSFILIGKWKDLWIDRNNMPIEEGPLQKLSIISLLSTQLYTSTKPIYIALIVSLLNWNLVLKLFCKWR